MKKYIALSALLIALVSCGGDQKETSVETLLASGTLEQLHAKQKALKAEVSAKNEQLAQLEKALEEKNPRAKKEVLVTTMTVKDTVFNHFIEVQGNVKTKQNVLIYPEYQGTLTRVVVKEGQRVRKGQTLARIDDG